MEGLSITNWGSKDGHDATIFRRLRKRLRNIGSKTCQAISSSFLWLQSALVLSMVITFYPDPLTIYEQNERNSYLRRNRCLFSNRADKTWKKEKEWGWNLRSSLGWKTVTILCHTSLVWDLVKLCDEPYRKICTNKSHDFCSNRAYALMRQAAIFFEWNERMFLHYKRVQLHQDWFGTPTFSTCTNPIIHLFYPQKFA